MGEHLRSVHEPAGSDACVINIGPQQQQLRVQGAYLFLALGVALAALLVGLGVAWPWRITVFLPFLIAAISGLQARHKT